MLATQVAYLQNKETQRHNLMTERQASIDATIRQQEANTKQFEADTSRKKLGIDQGRLELDSVNALTAQTEAQTRQRAQNTNEARRLQDYELALRNLEVAHRNADSTAIQAQASAYLDYARGEQTKLETELLPYSTGANIAGSVVSAISKAVAPAKQLGKAAKNGIQSLLYNIRN